MQQNEFLAAAQSSGSVIPANKVLRNTYALLALTLAFSAVCAGIGMVMNFPFIGLWMLLPHFILLFAIEKTKHSSMGLVFTFLFTGWLGLTLSPLLSMVIGAKGAEPVLLALGGTALIFFVTSGYVLATGKDMSGMTKFIMVGILVAFIAGIANAFLNISGLGLAVSSMFLVLSSLMIMWQTSAIIHGGETNYISATVTIFVSLYNVFISLLQLIMAFGGDD